MNAFRTYSRVNPSGRIIVKDVPFAAGLDLEVLLLPREPEIGGHEKVREIRALLKETQKLPQLRTITEEEIRDEIRAVRSGT